MGKQEDRIVLSIKLLAAGIGTLGAAVLIFKFAILGQDAMIRVMDTAFGAVFAFLVAGGIVGLLSFKSDNNNRDRP